MSGPLQIRAVVFDLDGTLVQYGTGPFESSWDALGDAAGLADQWNDTRDYFYPRRHLYDEWLAANARLLQGVHFEAIRPRLLPPAYAPNVRRTLDLLRATYRLGILSSGVDLVADFVRRDLGFDFAIANELHLDCGVFNGTATRHVGLWEKDVALATICASQDVRPAEICFVGDHENDIPVMQRVGYAIAYGPKSDRVARAADRVVEDLTEIPPLLLELESERSTAAEEPGQ